MKLQWSENWKKITGEGDFFFPWDGQRKNLERISSQSSFWNVGDNYDRKSREESDS
jgi:hypothetical protein